jgi:HIT domain
MQYVQTSLLRARPTLDPNSPCLPPQLGLFKKTDPFQLVIPKHHGAKLTDIPDDQLSEILPVVKKLASASEAENYNILQNNGRLAHQVVDHVRTRFSLLWNQFPEREF